jgi:DNA-binding CsgD family transcriptional regulator/sugar-specific transcriptional regulator TrmB
MLSALGLNETTEKVYRGLLAFPGFGVEELSAHLLLPEAEVHTALAELADLALLRVSREDPGVRLPVSLQRAMAILLQRQQNELETRRAQLAASREQVTALLTEPATGGDPIERLLGLDAIQARLEELMTAATEEVLALIPGGPQAPATLAAARPLDEDLAARGLTRRSVYQDSMRADRTNMDYARWTIGLGAQVRTAPLVPPRMIIIDRRIAVLAFDPDATARGIAILREPGVLAGLLALFEQTWSDGTDLETTEAGGDDDITPMERELLRMLAAGLTDEAAAKRLGVSLRTVKRRMEVLMRRLDAGSRFEAGFKAGQRGWL